MSKQKQALDKLVKASVGKGNNKEEKEKTTTEEAQKGDQTQRD